MSLLHLLRFGQFDHELHASRDSDGRKERL